MCSLELGWYTLPKLMSQDQTKSTPPDKKPWMVWLALLAATVIFLLAASVIYYRFMTTPETDCNIFVSGNPSLEGYLVTVQRVSADPNNKRSLSDTLNKSNQYNARFFLPSGTYRVEVWDRQPLRLESESEFIPPGSRLLLDLNRKYPVPADKPGTAPYSPR